MRRIMARVIGRRGAPAKIRSDNGSEFACEALSGWLSRVGSESIPVAPWSPWQNGYIKSFHGKLRDEFLRRVEFETVSDAVEKAKWQSRESNTIRPHSLLGYKTPTEFGDQCDGTRSNQELCKSTDRPENKR